MSGYRSPGRDVVLASRPGEQGDANNVIDLDVLNREQRTAVERVDGPLAVLAGAGSGKTRTLTYRIAHILEQRLASPHGILAITFTRKAAWELRRRLEELVGQASADITAVTFHSLGYKILSAESGNLGYKPDALAICDASAARRLLQRAMQETGIDTAHWNVAEVAAIIERAKDNLYGPDAFVQVKGDFFEECIAKIYTRYQQLLKENNAVDYGDLIRLSVQLLRQNPSTLAFYQQLFRYVSVDEFQDSSFGQYQLVRHLVWQHRNLCCVGSPVQAIYSWRGADIANILQRFDADFPNAPRVVLHMNYRSTGNILNAAQQVVRNLPYREELTTDNVAGDPIAVVASHTDWDEADYIAAEIQRLVHELHYRYEDCAILFRTRAQGRLFEQVLMHRELPYTLVGDFRFFERREIKDLLAYLRLIHDLFDAGALQRIINRPPRGLGPAALAKLQAGEPELTFVALSGLDKRTDLPERVRHAALEFAEMLFGEFAMAAKEKTLPDLLDYVLTRSGYLDWVHSDPEAKQRLANLAQLRVLTQRYDGVADALASFLADIASMGDQDVGLPFETNGVTLATIHAVKGLEFPIVFLAGLEEDIFPHAKALKLPGGIEEEQRLAYVGMTRAMIKLYLSYARTRQVGENVIEYSPSRFLAALPRNLVEQISASAPATVTVLPPLETASDYLDTESTPEMELVPPMSSVSSTLDEDGRLVRSNAEEETASETDLDLWLREGQSSWLECEVERAEEIEAWVLSEIAEDNTDLEAEARANDDMVISEELDAQLAEMQHELLDHLMELAEIEYEREALKRLIVVTPISTQSVGNAADRAERPESEAEDLDALAREYADEIRQHQLEKVAQGNEHGMGQGGT